ncbi:hypothetical protein ABID56_000002 [Alkalibacillus flavidus]|uniref:DinB-like domain-containing protein n=1 Tax=Alkalibacillus flavidus TaxID=546021 RepID=A0ABV2KQQ8_9BACI
MDVKFPIGPLEVPEDPTLEDVQAWMKDVDTYTIRLREMVDGLSEADLQKTYREGSYTVKQMVHHIADSQLNMYQRLKLALTDDNPKVPAFDQDKWAVQPDAALPVESSIKMLEGINERVVAVGANVSAEDLKRVFTHPDNGEISVATKLAKLSWHEEHHLAHIKLALEQ